MKSFLLQELSRLILPLAVLLAVSLLLKGHDLPGGGFVSGLSLAVAGILGFTAYGLERFQSSIRVEPERVALLGGLLILASLVVPIFIGYPPLSHAHGQIGVGLFSLELHSTLIFDIGVVLAVGGGFSAAARMLWEARPIRNEDR